MEGIVSAPPITRVAHRHRCFNCWQAPTREELTSALSATPSMLARAKVTRKQKPRGRLWLNDGSCVRLRPTHANHVWSCDFVSARTHDGRKVRLLNLIDESTRECRKRVVLAVLMRGVTTMYPHKFMWIHKL